MADVIKSLTTLLFGMMGIFATMGVIIISLVLLGKFSKGKDDGETGRK